MKVLRRYFTGEIYRSVLFVLVAFLALFAFFDLMGELGSVGRGPYRLEHAFVYVAAGLPSYAYELMPIAALIGTIYVMAQFAARSEFTVMRASSLSMGRALRMLVRISVVLAVITFVLGEFVAPKSNDFRQQFKRRIEGSSLSAEFRSGLWAKDVIRDPGSNTVVGSRFINASKIEPGGAVRGVNLFEFDQHMHMRARISADRAEFVEPGVWRLTGVDEIRMKPAEASERMRPELLDRNKLDSSTLRSDITPEILSVLMADPKRMSAVDLALFSRHLRQNKQRSEQYEIALWSKLLYPVAVIVMMVLALPFAYMHARSGGLSLKVFIGIMIGMGFHLLNNLFSHIGLLNTWPPFATAVLPSVLFLLAAISALWWVERH
jgi:lipopolysaccharide export system permease protein